MKPHLAKYRDIEHRLVSNSVLDLASGCWDWIGRTTRDGYPLMNVRVGQKHVTLRAHRVAFEELTGETIGTDMELDHSCHNRRCICPDHLQQVTKHMNLNNRRNYRRLK